MEFVSSKNCICLPKACTWMQPGFTSNQSKKQIIDKKLLRPFGHYSYHRFRVVAEEFLQMVPWKNTFRLYLVLLSEVKYFRLNMCRWTSPSPQMRDPPSSFTHLRKHLKTFVQKGHILVFWPIFIFCMIELIFGRLNCFDMKNIIL